MTALPFGFLQPLATEGRKEQLAVYQAICHFFLIQTDHMPLVHGLTRQADAWSLHQCRYLSAIAEFNCSIQHLLGRKNSVADALSRVSIDAVHLELDYNHLAKEQQQDPETSACSTSITSLKWKDVPVNKAGDAKDWIRSCTICQTPKIQKHTETGPVSFYQPQRRFAHIHVNIVGPLLPSEGHCYLFTIVDRSTRWHGAIPMSNASSASFTATLLSRFSIPAHMTFDRNTSFISQLWMSLGQLLGTSIHHTTAYNPEANDMVECFHRTLKAALISRCSNSMWFSQLPWVLLDLRTTPKEGLDVSPAEMVFGYLLLVPGEFFPNAPSSDDITRLRRIVGKFAPCKQTYRPHEHCPVPKDLCTMNTVLQGGPPPLTCHGASLLMGEYNNHLVASLLDPAVTSDDHASGWPHAICQPSHTLCSEETLQLATATALITQLLFVDWDTLWLPSG
ncbi:uncharacterized protein LOC119580591 [Penaeus monodon]|uniref:uncharacterized protein LOC119580591 n=1 Tax=Penaeus monodon TaxID=6687 RepID=UPI0018A785BB|nr:uncharacterized protein LOC119580591 [Penaeus monodon]